MLDLCVVTLEEYLHRTLCKDLEEVFTVTASAANKAMASCIALHSSGDVPWVKAFA